MRKLTIVRQAQFEALHRDGEKWEVIARLLGFKHEAVLWRYYRRGIEAGRIAPRARP